MLNRVFIVFFNEVLWPRVKFHGRLRVPPANQKKSNPFLDFEADSFTILSSSFEKMELMNAYYKFNEIIYSLNTGCFCCFSCKEEGEVS